MTLVDKLRGLRDTAVYQNTNGRFKTYMSYVLYWMTIYQIISILYIAAPLGLLLILAGFFEFSQSIGVLAFMITVIIGIAFSPNKERMIDSKVEKVSHLTFASGNNSNYEEIMNDFFGLLSSHNIDRPRYDFVTQVGNEFHFDVISAYDMVCRLEKINTPS